MRKKKDKVQDHPVAAVPVGTVRTVVHALWQGILFGVWRTLLWLVQLWRSTFLLRRQEQWWRRYQPSATPAACLWRPDGTLRHEDQTQTSSSSASSSSSRNSLSKEDLHRQTLCLKKRPNHVALVVAEAEALSLSSKERTEGALSALLRVVVWLLASGVPHVSLFDGNGELAERADLILRGLQEQSFLRLRAVPPARHGLRCAEKDAPYRLCFDVVSNCDKKKQQKEEERKEEGEEGEESKRFCTVNILSHHRGGRFDLVQGLRDYCRNVEQLRNSSSVPIPLQERLTRDSVYSSLCGIRGLEDPQLMLKFDKIEALPAFPPWHSALIEILELGQIGKVEWRDVLGALRWYSSSVQRYGS
ncbi:ditrans,polycis-polyprenyl diphosphate synthase [Balamuthia mandrillaris]